MIDGIGEHLDHVEPDIQIVAARFHQKIARDFDVPLLFMPLHRLGGRAEFFGKAGFHLAEHDRIFVERDDVRFAERGAVIFFEYLAAGFFQVFGRPPFSASAENFFVNVLR